MSIFSKTRAVLWPQDGKLEIYLEKKENNVFTLDLNLWEIRTDTDLVSLRDFISQNRIGDITVLIPDDVIVTRSFIYDTSISSVEKKEVASLAQGMVNFDIDPDFIDFSLTEKGDQTIIQSHITNKDKYSALNSNLVKAGLTIHSYIPISAAIANVASTFNSAEYFFLYPLDRNETLLFLARGNQVFLATTLKGTNLDIQQTINYANLYFDRPVTKLYLPQDSGYDLTSTTKLDKTGFKEVLIAQSLGKADNFPIPVLGSFSGSSKSAPQPAIISDTTSSPISSQPTMQNQKNLLPIIAVFILTAAIASVIFWFVANRDSEDVALNNPSGQVQDISPSPDLLPTSTPIPTIAIDKAIKIQVLNATSINGQAAILKEKLTGLGFTSVAVGNSREKVTGHEIRLKLSMAAVQAYFDQDLGSYFPATYSTDLPETSTYDAVFVIGADLSQTDQAPPSSEATSTASPSPDAAGTSTPAAAE